MRRISIALVCVAAAAVLASSAWAKTDHYSGKVEATNAGDIDFDVVKRNGTPRKVKNVAFDNLKLHCEDDVNTSLSRAFVGTAKVSGKGRFTLESDGDSFRGRIGGGGEAHGRLTIHYQHMFHGECVNKQHDWSAKQA